MPGPEAEKLAQKMLTAAGYSHWLKTAAASFTFRGEDKIFWDRKRRLVEVVFKGRLVQFSELSGKSVCFEGERRELDACAEWTAQAVKRFYNHTFWLNPALHIMSPGAERLFVSPNQLLVTFTFGGSTPGDSYLFVTDNDGRIKEMQMWVSILPIKGVRATFANYITTQTGVTLALDHEVASLASVRLSDVVMYPEYPPHGVPDRFTALLEIPISPAGDSLNRKM
ncbi:MAG: hypothetical protein N2Z22_10090 [Turneriella sp.]|nr:hypothetical protein [Turneriella sp.]